MLGSDSLERSILINALEIAFLSLLIISLIYFVVRIGKAVKEPDYVSPLTYLTVTSHPQSLFYPTASPVLTQSPGGFCGSCGKPLLPNAQYCGYCGSKHEFLEIPREKSMRQFRSD